MAFSSDANAFIKAGYSKLFDKYTNIITNIRRIKSKHISLWKLAIFLFGHVQDVFIFKVSNHGFCYIKTEVLPSQRQGLKETLYKVWVALHENGLILCANCTCTSG